MRGSDVDVEYGRMRADHPFHDDLRVRAGFSNTWRLLEAVVFHYGRGYR